MFPNMKATTCSSVNISKVSVVFDVTIVLFDKLVVEINLVGGVPLVGTVNG